MIHARSDYNSIQDNSGRIPANEPVFVLRGQDMIAPDVVEAWANMAESYDVDPDMIEAARRQADAMRAYQAEYGGKVPDAPADVLCE